jgi:hypothetical protein
MIAVLLDFEFSGRIINYLIRSAHWPHMKPIALSWQGARPSFSNFIE